ncbi:hypothetical protein EDD15DRAFT_2330686 [Pisolithus albus]|nr:hypothetical protein EDD15DRAFT_2330686 [Pisolithus albus]
MNLRTCSLYPSETQRTEDAGTFSENVVIDAYTSESGSGSDWWYGTTINDGRSAFSRRPLYK